MKISPNKVEVKIERGEANEIKDYKMLPCRMLLFWIVLRTVTGWIVKFTKYAEGLMRHCSDVLINTDFYFGSIL